MALVPQPSQSLHSLFVSPVYVFVTLGSRHHGEGTSGHPRTHLPPTIASPTTRRQAAPSPQTRQSGTPVHHRCKSYCDVCPRGLCRKRKESAPSCPGQPILCSLFLLPTSLSLSRYQSPNLRTRVQESVCVCKSPTFPRGASVGGPDGSGMTTGLAHLSGIFQKRDE